MRSRSGSRSDTVIRAARVDARWLCAVLSAYLALCVPADLSGQAAAPDSLDDRAADSTRIVAEYRNRRVEIATADGNHLMTLQWRFQFRASTPFDTPPSDASALATVDQATFRIRRARLKVGGHAYRPWLEYYLEYDFPSTTLLDWRISLGRPSVQLRVGQWKVNYSRERVSSSGEQQFVERSIVNTTFTLDRQVGVMLFGHLFAGSGADLRYYVGALTGTGAGATTNDDDRLLWLGRLEWQPLGTDPGMEGGDFERRPDPALTVAVAGARNRSPFTRFSGSGGGQLTGFDTGEAGQYGVGQAMVETAFTLRGFSWQHETHWKRIDDRATGERTDYRGTYVQAGFFPSEVFEGLPEPLEIGARWAYVSGGPVGDDPDVREAGAVANWYFAGHRNKLTFDLFRVDIEDPSGSADRWRARLQWDLSF